MSFDPFRAAHNAGRHIKRVVKRATDCATGGMYIAPTAGQSISPSSNVNITWDNSCLGSPSPALVDIYVYAPSASVSLVHVWGNVPASTGSYSDVINPSWWNATAGSTESLYLLIVEANQPSWMTSIPSGPIFKVTTPSDYTPSASAGSTTSGNSGSSSANTSGSSSWGNSIYQSVTNLFKNGLPKGAIAAAVLIPILLLALAGFLYIRWNRKKEAAQRSRFSQALDKRMSVISSDWKPSSAAAARASIAVGAHRGSLATSVYMPRPSSTFATEGGQAGVGAYGQEMSEKAIPRPSFQTQRSLGAPGSDTARKSRISFAPTVHPRLSMAAKDVLGTAEEEDEGAMSPTQMHGPTLLADDDVARGSMDEAFRTEVLQMPAMTMMRTGRQSTHIPQAQDMSRAQSNSGFRSPSPTSMAPGPISLNTQLSPTNTGVASPPSAKSPLTGFFPASSPAPTGMMTPDEQLRAYAARRAASPLPPQPAAVGSHPGMRVLYDPSAHQPQSLSSAAASVIPSLPPTQPLNIAHTGATLRPESQYPQSQGSPSRLSVATNNPFRQSAISMGGESAASRYSGAEMQGLPSHEHEHEHVAQHGQEQYEYDGAYEHEGQVYAHDQYARAHEHGQQEYEEELPRGSAL